MSIARGAGRPAGRRAALLAAAVLLTGCVGDPAPGSDPMTRGWPSADPPEDVITPGDPPTAEESPAYVATSPPPLPGRRAPDAFSGPLRFTQVRVFSDIGRFAGRANVTNTTGEFLNDVRFEWVIRRKQGGTILDRGEASWPNLAPGETASVTFQGSEPYADTAVVVSFAYRSGGDPAN